MNLKIGIVGLGLMGERHVRVFDKMPLVEIHSLCDTNEARVKAMGAQYGAKTYTDVEEMLKDPELDAVDIVLPDNLHLRAVELAVKYRKHIMVEKPMARVLDEAQKIYEITKEYDKTFMIGHILRFDPRYSGAKEAAESGKLGEIVSLYARRNSPITGPLHYIGATDLSTHVMVHDIDAVEWILQSRIRSVYAKASRRILKQYNMTDAIHAVVTFENGAIGSLEACWILPENCPASIDDKLEIIGTKGVLYTGSCGNGLEMISGEGDSMPDSRHWPEINGGISGALYEELTAFVNCILKNKKSIITPLDGLSAIKVVSAVEQSIKEGKEISVN